MNAAEASFEAASRRTLAAIVFSDVAGFSALMQSDEDRTLKLVHRDLSLLRATCEKHHGRVLKSTGDGLLMYFDSAVQAVGCALEAQQALAQQGATLPKEQVLLHRIGIHLGDVFVSESDVMGDGVNIAARLQTEADPGGICISQTVYDVVKNRLAVKATYLGPRELKNIQEAVPVYQILLDAAGGAAAKPAMRAKPKQHVGGPWLWVLGGTVLAVVALAVVMVVFVLKGSPQQPTPQANLSGGGAVESPGPYTTQPAASQPAGPAPRAPVVDPLAAERARRDAELNDARRRFLMRYDYSGMIAWLEQKNLKDAPVYDRYTRLKKMRTTLIAKLTMASEAQPLKVSLPTGPADVWGTVVELNIRDATGTRQGKFDQLSAELMAAMAEAADQQGGSILRDELRLAGMLR
jgi:class 3 adenylate cyclase